jgi:hypothetical protein
VNAHAVKSRFLSLRMRWRVVIVIVVLYAVAGIATAIGSAVVTNSFDYEQGYEYGLQFDDLAGWDEDAERYCNRVHMNMRTLADMAENPETHFDGPNFFDGCMDALTP